MASIGWSLHYGSQTKFEGPGKAKQKYCFFGYWKWPSQKISDQSKSSKICDVRNSNVLRFCQFNFYYFRDEQLQSSAIPSPNLEFASLCLLNALSLINYYSTLANTEKPGTSKADKNESFGLFGNWNKTQDGIACNPSKPLTKQGIEKLKMTILTACSYVAICLGEYTLALKYGKELILMPNIPDTHKWVYSLLWGCRNFYNL